MRAKFGSFGTGGGSGGAGLVNFVTLATLPAASAGNVNQAFCVADDNGGRLLGSTGTSMVPLAAAVAEGASPVSEFGGSSRALTAADNGSTLEVAAGGLTVTVPESLPQPFRVFFLLLTGTTSFDPTGTTQINGGTATLTRAAGSNPLITLQSRTAANGYTLTGA